MTLIEKLILDQTPFEFDGALHFFGGPGSGNWGHKGRPGQRGGSLPRGTGGTGLLAGLLPGAAQAIEAAFSKCAAVGEEKGVELGILIDTEGRVLRETVGEAGIVMDLKKVPSDAENSVHNHPESGGFSSGDVNYLLTNAGLKNEFVVDSEGTRYRISKTDKTPTPGELYPDKISPNLYVADDVHKIWNDIISQNMRDYYDDKVDRMLTFPEIKEQAIQIAVDRYKLVYSRDPPLSELMELSLVMSLQEPMHELAQAGYDPFIRCLLEQDYHFRTDGQRVVVLGGPGSGNWGHRGRPGKRGGSAPNSTRMGTVILTNVPPNQVKNWLGQIEQWDGSRQHIARRALLTYQYKPEKTELCVTERAGELKGIAAIIPKPFQDPNKVELAYLATKERGYGREIFFKVAERASDEHLGLLWESTTKAVPFYEHLGFSAIYYHEGGGADFDLAAWQLEDWIEGVSAMHEGIFADIEPEDGVFATRHWETEEVLLGGPGSGNWGHAGRPGLRGGSLPRSGAMSIRGKDWRERQQQAKGAPVFGSDGYRTSEVAPSAGDPQMEDARQQLIQGMQEVNDQWELLSDKFDVLSDEARAAFEESGRLYMRASEIDLHGEPAKPGEDFEAMRIEANRLSNLADSRWAEQSEISTQLNALRAIKGRMTQQFLEVDDPAGFQAVVSTTGLSQGTIRSAMEGVDEAGKMVAYRPGFGFSPMLKVQKADGTRAYFDDDKIHVSDSSWKKTVIHETGHWVEKHDKSAAALAQGFIKVRTQGETLRPLAQVIPGSSYDADEITRADKFWHAYTGRKYSHSATEVVSMGLEHMYKDPVKFAKRDPMHFDVTFAIMHNDYGSPFMQNLINEGQG